MVSRNRGLGWFGLAFVSIAVIVACGGSNGATIGASGGPGGGSAVCGPNGASECGQCSSNADCSGATPACWPSDHRCHPACTASTSCPQNAKTCDTSTGAC